MISSTSRLLEELHSNVAISHGPLRTKAAPETCGNQKEIIGVPFWDCNCNLDYSEKVTRNAETQKIRAGPDAIQVHHSK